MGTYKAGDFLRVVWNGEKGCIGQRTGYASLYGISATGRRLDASRDARRCKEEIQDAKDGNST